MIKERIQLSSKPKYYYPYDEDKFWCGIVKVRELPDGCTEEDFKAWWPALSEQERERYTACEHHNILTLSGFTQLLTYISSGNATTLGFSQFFSVGTFPIITVQAGDTGVSGEIYRSAPTSQSIVGNQLTLSTYFAPSQAVGTYTNAGLWGVNATGTANSGTLMTHTLYNYPKSSSQAISNDYIIILQ
jgi:hypothetical protein